MGWMSGYTDRNLLVKHVTESHETDYASFRVIKKFFSGNNLWTVWERQSKSAPTDIERFIVLFLIRRYVANDWGYKDVVREWFSLVCGVRCSRDYQSMSNQQLASLLRQFRRSKHQLSCEFGHFDCGCSNVPTMNGNAACSQEVDKEIQRRATGKEPK